MEDTVCALCGREKRLDSLVCPRCFEDYRKQALERRGISKLLDWIEQRARARLPEVQAKRDELKNLRARLDALSTEVRNETTTRLREMLGGEQISRNEWLAMWDDLRKQIWQEKGGNALYAQSRRLETEVAFLSSVGALLDEIARRKKAQQEDKIAERLVNQALPPGPKEKQG